MDSQLQRLAKDCKATNTRYADDITFSTTIKDFPADLAYIVNEDESEKVVLGDRLFSIIRENGFSVNEKKTRLQTKGNHQEVTGLTTNQFPNVDRRYVRQVRAMLHAWAKFGLESAQKEFEEKYNQKARFSGKQTPRFQDVLKGKIEFIGMVKGKMMVFIKNILINIISYLKFIYRKFIYLRSSKFSLINRFAIN